MELIFLSISPILLLWICGLQRFYSGLDRVLNALISGTAAEVAFQPHPNRLLIRIGMRPEKREGVDNETGGTETTLVTRLIQERSLNHRIRDPLDGGDFGTLRFDREDHAGLYRSSIQQNRAGTAVAVLAAGLGTGQTQVIPQNLQQCIRRTDLDLAVLPVHTQENGDCIMVFYHEIFLALPRHNFSDGGLDIQFLYRFSA